MEDYTHRLILKVILITASRPDKLKTENDTTGYLNSSAEEIGLHVSNCLMF